MKTESDYLTSDESILIRNAVKTRWQAEEPRHDGAGFIDETGADAGEEADLPSWVAGARSLEESAIIPRALAEKHALEWCRALDGSTPATETGEATAKSAREKLVTLLLPAAKRKFVQQVGDKWSVVEDIEGMGSEFAYLSSRPNDYGQGPMPLILMTVNLSEQSDVLAFTSEGAACVQAANLWIGRNLPFNAPGK